MITFSCNRRCRLMSERRHGCTQGDMQHMQLHKATTEKRERKEEKEDG